MGCYVERHEAEMFKVKKKQQEFVVGMFVLDSIIINMIVNTRNYVTVANIKDNNELDV